MRRLQDKKALSCPYGFAARCEAVATPCRKAAIANGAEPHEFKKALCRLGPATHRGVAVPIERVYSGRLPLRPVQLAVDFVDFDFERA
jgi:hypothetical protein